MAKVKINSTTKIQPAAKGFIANRMGLINRKATITCLYHLGDLPKKFCAIALRISDMESP
jgi:hypothetical protein